MAQDATNKGLTELATDLLDEVLNLIRGEARLARAEMVENIRQATDGLVVLAGGVGLLTAGVVVMLQAIVIGLTNLGLSPGWSAVFVGIATIAAAGALFWVGTSRLRLDALKPERTLNQVRKDRALLKRVAEK